MYVKRQSGGVQPWISFRPSYVRADNLRRRHTRDALVGLVSGPDGYDSQDAGV